MNFVLDSFGFELHMYASTKAKQQSEPERSLNYGDLSSVGGCLQSRTKAIAAIIIEFSL